jgi:aryl-alcohol dehydrogenase-like predicted oxidoreductase
MGLRPLTRFASAPAVVDDARKISAEETTMEMRQFGRTGMRVSLLGFGCGAVGGLMVRGAPADQERAVARALEAGVNYFDTAVAYGDGTSEENLGRALRKLKPAQAYVGTKVRLPPAAFVRIGDFIAESLAASLRRLGMEAVDILHLHNPITRAGGGHALSVRQVLEEVVPAFARARQAGKVRFGGITCVGDTEALHAVVESRAFESGQVGYNMLNPSAASPLRPNYPAQDFARVFDRMRAVGAGIINIRVLAAGALSGSSERHPLADPPPAPIGSALSYEADLARARRLMPLVDEGFADTLAEAATRFVISSRDVGTILVGMATIEQFEAALAAVEKGPLSSAALARLAELQAQFVGETR